MKISRVVAYPRRACFIITIKNKRYEFPFAYLKHRPNSRNPVVVVHPDMEVGSEAFFYRLKNGKSDTVLAEQVLHYNRDPEVIRKELLYQLSCQAQDLIQRRGVSKRSVARQLAVQPTHLYRLLDQTFYGKTIDQMVRLFASLGEQIEIKVKTAA
jgi:hypothetical protein